MTNIYCIVPTIGTNQYISSLVPALEDQPHHTHTFVLNNSGDNWIYLLGGYPNTSVANTVGMNLYQQWNHGVDLCLAEDPNCYIAVLNDDLMLGDGALKEMAYCLDINPYMWLVSANYGIDDIDGSYREWKQFPGTFKDRGVAGFAFMVRGDKFHEGLLRFEEGYSVWHGDDDILLQVLKHGGRLGMAANATVHHFNGGSNSFGDRCRYVNDENRKDTELYLQKWHS